MKGIKILWVLVALAPSSLWAQTSKSAIDPALNEVLEAVAPYKKISDSLARKYNAARENNDKAAMRLTRQQQYANEKRRNEEVYARFVELHPASPVALEVLFNYTIRNVEDCGRIQRLFQILPDSVRHSEKGMGYSDWLTKMAATSEGAQAADFTQSDTIGHPVTLSSYKGKYVLVDFWASWCSPCREQNKDLIAAYQQFHPKGLAMLSISIDKATDREKWLKAIHDDHLQWTQVSDLQSDNAAAKLYGIERIPRTFLIDPNGKIIASGLRGEELNDELKCIFNN